MFLFLHLLILRTRKMYIFQFMDVFTKFFLPKKKIRYHLSFRCLRSWVWVILRVFVWSFLTASIKGLWFGYNSKYRALPYIYCYLLSTLSNTAYRSVCFIGHSYLYTHIFICVCVEPPLLLQTYTTQRKT